jgi:hypothetical protein
MVDDRGHQNARHDREGRLKRVASTMASNWVLSPISARATTAVEVEKASRRGAMAKQSGAGRTIETNDNCAIPPGRANREAAIGLARGARSGPVKACPVRRFRAMASRPSMLTLGTA